jgi:hypothetical protein
VVHREADTDPRPLYFIPYDPDISQSAEERAFCRRVLFERMQSATIAALGRVSPPGRVKLDSKGMLNDATFGMYDHWQNRDSNRHMKQLCRQFMNAVNEVLDSVVPGALVFVENQGWEISVENPESHEKMLDVLAGFSCETLDLRTEPQAGLFDDLADDGPTSIRGS